jgi:pyrroloquinoline-quinone synthase
VLAAGHLPVPQEDLPEALALAGSFRDLPQAFLVSCFHFHPGDTMDIRAFNEQLDLRIAQYDLLCHPFYQAWSAGRLTRDDLRAYATEYFRQVNGFPACLRTFADRLDDDHARRAVLANLADEEGRDSQSGGGTPHPELWLDFAEGMGADREAVRQSPCCTEVAKLTDHFRNVAASGSPEEALAAFYAFESQVPRVAQEKARGLREWYSADEKTCRYFTLHATADVFHANVWREMLTRRVEAEPPCADAALVAAESAARSLWTALDGIEAQRLARTA